MKLSERIARDVRYRSPLIVNAFHAASIADDLLEVLEECSADLESEIQARAAGELPRRIARDLEPVERAKALIARARKMMEE